MIIVGGWLVANPQLATNRQPISERPIRMRGLVVAISIDGLAQSRARELNELACFNNL